MLSDISFDEKGDMFLGVRDRIGDCVSQSGGFLSSGDIYKACKTATGWTLENNATCGTVTTGGANNKQGPGGGEFIYQDLQGDGVRNSGTGGVFNLMGRRQVISTTMDPVYLNSSGVQIFNPSAGGVQVFSAQEGTLKGAFDLYEVNDINTFAKAAGVGAIAVLCNPAPLQIGNYVWIDTDKDGVQDPCEGPLSNVTVSLWKNGVQIASTTTNSNGEYYFASKYLLGAAWTGTGADTTLLVSTAYEVRILMSQSDIATPNYALTTANNTTNNGNDQNDSDASISSGYAVIPFTTGAAGATNHTLDFGFFPCPTITNPSPTTQSLCVGATGANITVNTNYNAANGIKFVKFTTDQMAGTTATAAELVAIYAGTSILTVTPTGASNPFTATYTWNSADFPNATTSPITYYVYAILNPDLGAACRPVQEVAITVNPKPTTPSVSAAQTNTCPATTVNLTTISAAATPSVSGGVFEWRVSNVSSSALVTGQTAVGAGTYYLFEKSTAGCYSSGKAVTVTIQVCCPTPVCIPLRIARIN